MITAAEIAEAPVPWIATESTGGEANQASGDNAKETTDTADDRILFTRIVARRNFSGFPFWISCAPEACTPLSAHARAHAAAHGFAKGLHLAELAPETIGVLRERMQLPDRPAAFPGKRDFKMIFPGPHPREHALFGETEHWTHIRILPGSASASETRTLSSFGNEKNGEEGSEGEPVFSRSSEWGYLTSDPSFAGHGLQLEAGLHLPALTAARQIPQVQQALSAMGLELQPLSLRHPGAAEAGFFRLLSRGGMDLSLEDLHRRFTGKRDRLLNAETEALERWRTRESNLLQDRMHRSLRLLQEARRMDFAELLLLASFARTGVYAGIFPLWLLSALEELRVKAQPFHVRATWQGPQAMHLEEELSLRAEQTRLRLAQA